MSENFKLIFDLFTIIIKNMTNKNLVEFTKNKKK